MKRIIQVPLSWARNLYDWVLSWADSRYALPALGTLSFVESSFFPIAPDPLLIAMCIGAHKRWAKFALVTSVASVAGGIAGYGIGWFAFDTIGQMILNSVATISGSDPDQLLQTASYWFNEKEAFGFKLGPWAVGVAGFTPIPYKVFTISAGFFKMDFAPFVIASAISRSLRFFAVAGLIGLLYKRYGAGISDFIDRRFNLLTIGFLALMILGIMAIRLF